MIYLKVFLILYLIVGFGYAVYILLFAGDRWFWFPVNVFGWPFAFVYLAFAAFPVQKRTYKAVVEKKKAAIFDLDDTLVATGIYWDSAFSKVLTATKSGSYMGLRSGHCIVDQWNIYLDEHPGEISMTARELTEHTYAEFLKHLDELSVTDGFWDLAMALKDERAMRLGMVTNTDKVVAEKVLTKLNLLEVFDVVIYGDEVEHRKPNPQMYNLAAQKLGVRAGEVVVFEDSVVGAQAAVGAKMDAYVVWNGTAQQTDYPKGVLDFFPDFVGFNEKLAKTDIEHARELAEQPQ